jgi:hypothetical protein
MTETEKSRRAPWSKFIKRGDFERGFALLSAEIERRHDDGLLYRERAHVQLYLGRTQEARSDFDITERLDSAVFRTRPGRLHANAAYDAIGATYWMDGHRDLAIAFWRYTTQALCDNHVDYSRMGGGIDTGLLLWFGAVHQKLEEDLNLILTFYESRLKSTFWSHNLSGWPGPIVHFFRHQIDEQQLMDAAREDEQYLCEAHFAAAIRARELRRYAAYWKHLAQSAPRKGPHELYDYYNVLPYFLARFELDAASR